MDTVLISAGAVIGANARYWVGRWVAGALPLAVFPWGTWLINVTGSLALGVFLGWDSVQPASTSWRLFFATGVCGAYTTFSTFSGDTLNLIRDGDYAIAVSYVALSLALGLAAAVAGFLVGRAI